MRSAGSMTMMRTAPSKGLMEVMRSRRRTWQIADAGRLRVVVIGDVAEAAGLDDFEVGVGVGVVSVFRVPDAEAGAAAHAGGFGGFTDEGLGEADGETALADAFGAGDEQGVGRASVAEGCAEGADGEGAGVGAPGIGGGLGVVGHGCRIGEAVLRMDRGLEGRVRAPRRGGRRGFGGGGSDGGRRRWP